MKENSAALFLGNGFFRADKADAIDKVCGYVDQIVRKPRAFEDEYKSTQNEIGAEAVKENTD